MDERPSCACCQFQDQEILDTDAAQFDCETCEVRIAQASVFPENRDAWEMFQILSSRFVWDSQSLGAFFIRLTDGWTDDEVTDRLQRCAVIYDVLYPSPPAQGDSGGP